MSTHSEIPKHDVNKINARARSGTEEESSNSSMLIENANVDVDDDDADERQSTHISTQNICILLYIQLQPVRRIIHILYRFTAWQTAKQPTKNSFRREIVYVSSFTYLYALNGRARWRERVCVCECERDDLTFVACILISNYQNNHK